MNTTAKVILATAAAVFALALGYNYLLAPTVGGPRLFVPEPTPTPVWSSGSGPTRGTGLGAPNLEIGLGGSAGSYRITDFEPFSITITVPAAWESLAVPAMVWSADDEKATVAYFTVDDLFADPCDPTQGYLGRPNGRRLGGRPLRVPRHHCQLGDGRDSLRVQRDAA